MFPKNEFRKYATKHLGMSGMHLDNYMDQSTVAYPNVTGFTPQVIETNECGGDGCILKIDDGQNHFSWSTYQ